MLQRHPVKVSESHHHFQRRCRPTSCRVARSLHRLWACAGDQAERLPKAWTNDQRMGHKLVSTTCRSTQRRPRPHERHDLAHCSARQQRMELCGKRRHEQQAETTNKAHDCKRHTDVNRTNRKPSRQHSRRKDKRNTMQPGARLQPTTDLPLPTHRTLSTSSATATKPTKTNQQHGALYSFFTSCFVPPGRVVTVTSLHASEANDDSITTSWVISHTQAGAPCL